MGEMQPRDKAAIINIGKFNMMSQDQLLELPFEGKKDFTIKSGYRTFRRRYDRVLSDYLDDFYININKKGERKPIFRLNHRGKRVYQEETGKEYKKPRWSYQAIPHRIEVNWVIIKFYDIINSFELEYKKDKYSSLQMDALCRTRQYGKIAFEVDLSETEPQKTIKQKFKKYQSFQLNNGYPDWLIFYSNRRSKIYKWLEPIWHNSNLKLFCIKRKDKSIKKMKSKIKRY